MKSIDGKLNKYTFNHSGVSVNSNLFESRKLSQTRHIETRLERFKKKYQDFIKQ